MAVLEGTKEGLQVKVNLRRRVMVQGATTTPSSAKSTSGGTLKALGFMFTPSRPRRGIDSPVAIRRGEVAQMKWCRDPWCSPRGNPACRGTFAVASRVSSTVSHLRTEHGTSLETPGISVFPWSETGLLGNFGVASRVPSSISNFKMEHGTSLETLAVKGLILR